MCVLRHSFNGHCGRRVHIVIANLLCAIYVGDGLYAFWLFAPCRYPRNTVNVQLVRRGPRMRVHMCEITNVCACECGV